jgi:hypothetical protein
LTLMKGCPGQAEVSFKPTMICAGRLENDQHPYSYPAMCIAGETLNRWQAECCVLGNAK